MEPASSRAARFPCRWCPSWACVSWRLGLSPFFAHWPGHTGSWPRGSADCIWFSARLSRRATEADEMAKQSAVRQERRPAAQSVAEASPVKLDRLIHERLRLGILSALAADESLTFNELKKLLKTTDGNLSVHARKLEDAHYVTCTKSFQGRLPKTEYRLTAAGRRALERYLDHMEALIQAMRER